MAVLSQNKGLGDLSVSAAWGLSSLPVTCGVLWYLVWCLRLYTAAFLRLVALSLTFLPFPRDFENNVSKDKDQVKNILFPFFLPVSILERLVLSCFLVVLLAWSNPFLLSSCPSVYRLSPWSVFHSERIRDVYEGKWGAVRSVKELRSLYPPPPSDGEEECSAYWTFAAHFTVTFSKTKCKDFIILL